MAILVSIIIVIIFEANQATVLIYDLLFRDLFISSCKKSDPSGAR
jgi:hypothetical protein